MSLARKLFDMTSTALSPHIEYRSPLNDEEFAQLYDLRYRVLRAPWNQPLGSERCPKDATETHFGCFVDGMLVSTCRLDRLSPTTAQVRFVAVDNQHQGKGYGRTLMLELEKYAAIQGINQFILHSRENAVIFYKNLGFNVIGPSYKIWDLIQHYEMMKFFGKPEQMNENADIEEQHPISISTKSSTDQQLYATLQQTLSQKGIAATQALVTIFLQDIASKQ